jgi:hypothetical protein
MGFLIIIVSLSILSINLTLEINFWDPEAADIRDGLFSKI